MGRKILVFVFALLACGRDRPFESCRVRPEHPRVLIAKRELSDHAARVAPGGPLHEDYLRYKELVDNYLARDAAPDPNYILGYAFVYRMERELGRSDYERYADAVKLRIRLFGAGADRAARHSHSEYVAAWDWIYDAMKPQERRELGRILMAVAEGQAFVRQGLGFPSSLGAFDAGTMRQADAWLATALAFWNEGVNDEVVRRLYAGAGRFLKEQLVPGLRIVSVENSGASSAGFDAHIVAADDLARVFEMWRTATGDETVWDNDWAKGQGAFHAYFVVPHRGKLAAMQECSGYLEPGLVLGLDGLRKFEALVAARGRDGVLQHIVNEKSDIWGLDGGGGMCAWAHILWKDPELRPVPPQELPAARLFEGTGIAVMREGWNSPADCWAMLRVGDYYDGRQQVDCGMFAIARKGDLALDSGWKIEDEVREQGQYRHWYRKTIAHNSLLVFVPGEEGPKSCTRDGTDNDGGQTCYGNGERFRSPGPDGGLDLPVFPETGDMRAFRHTRFADYAAGDVTAAYGEKVSHVSRRMLYLRPQRAGEENLFLVFDRVVSPKAVTAKEGFAKRWIIHCQPPPRVRVGKEWQTAARGVQTYSATDFAFDAAGGTFLEPLDLGGSLVGRVLLPKEAILRTVGGPSHEFFYNGKNHPVPPGMWSEIIPGAWRIEVEPVRTSEEDFFLHILYPCDRGEELPGVETAEEGAHVRVTVKASKRTYRAAFDKKSLRASLEVLDAAGVPVETLDFLENLR